MNAMVSKMLNAYGQAQTDAGVETASPHKLISLLYEGALVAIANAKMSLAENDIAARGTSISKAIAIIDEGLKISVNLEAGGELAQNLKSLYEYMSYRLLMANMHGDAAALSEVESLLRELKGAWDQIGTLRPVTTAPPKPADQLRMTASYGKF